jgi:hypothetical protein
MRRHPSGFRELPFFPIGKGHSLRGNFAIWRGHVQTDGSVAFATRSFADNLEKLRSRKSAGAKAAKCTFRPASPGKELTYYSAFFLRRSTMIPRNRIASTAQTIRTVEESIVFLLS